MKADFHLTQTRNRRSKFAALISLKGHERVQFDLHQLLIIWFFQQVEIAYHHFRDDFKTDNRFTAHHWTPADGHDTYLRVISKEIGFCPREVFSPFCMYEQNVSNFL